MINPASTSRSEIGITMQSAKVRPWKRSIIWATVAAILPIWKGTWDEEVETIFEQYRKYTERIIHLDLPAAINLPPLLGVSFDHELV